MNSIYVTLVLLLNYTATATVYFTDKNKIVVGNRDGSWNSPFDKISDCVKRLKNKGDECQIRAGRYHEKVNIRGLKGSVSAPIKIRGYGSERPLIDGTTEILPIGGKWKKGPNGVYEGKISHKIWQLFLGDLMMTNARWPNAKWSDKSLFDGRKHWAKMVAPTVVGHIYDNELSKTKLNMTDAIAVLNIGSWNTFVSKVDYHKPGTNDFTYTDTFMKPVKKSIVPRISRYFLESKKNLLDAHEEWFFNQKTMMLYFIPPRKHTGGTFKLRGKIQTYAMTFYDCEYVQIKDIDFFGTTVKGITDRYKSINEITFHSLNFMFPSYSKRMLGEISITENMEINGAYRGKSTWKTFTFFNNTFHGADSEALQFVGSHVRLENNLFEYNDWTSANTLKYGGGSATIQSVSMHDTYIRNTLYYNGEGHGISPGGPFTKVELNSVQGQCFGYQQNDGAAIHVTKQPQTGVQIINNWVSDTPKYGVRFDSTPTRKGEFGTITGNVAFRCNAGGIQMKGDNHTARENMAFDKQNKFDQVLRKNSYKHERGESRSFPGCSLCVWKFVRSETTEINKKSRVVDNLADAANGCTKFDAITKKPLVPIQVWALAGKVVKNNVVDKKIKDMLYDADNNDFRVLPGTKAAISGAGPYPYQAAKLTEYWIPGRQLYKASSPVPPNAAKHVKAANRDALMWLNGYGCDTHVVYFGFTYTAVNNAAPSRKCKEYLGFITRSGNVMYLPAGTVTKNKTYFWRVDAYCPGKTKYRGDVWQFTTV